MLGVGVEWRIASKSNKKSSIWKWTGGLGGQISHLSFQQKSRVERQSQYPGLLAGPAQGKRFAKVQNQMLLLQIVDTY